MRKIIKREGKFVRLYWYSSSLRERDRLIRAYFHLKNAGYDSVDFKDSNMVCSLRMIIDGPQQERLLMQREAERIVEKNVHAEII